MSFLVNLLKVRIVQPPAAQEFLAKNCTLVGFVPGTYLTSDLYYVFEGEVGVADDAGLLYEKVGEGAILSLGGLRIEELSKLCSEVFGVEIKSNFEESVAAKVAKRIVAHEKDKFKGRVPETLRDCHDCAAKPNQPHQPECDVERCSVCGGQCISCDCSEEDRKKHDPLFARWTGLWPGKAEADALCVDLNEFHRKGYHRVFFVKPLEAK